MSYHLRFFLALAMAFGCAWSARAQDDSGAVTSTGVDAAGLSIVGDATLSLGGADTYTGGTTISPSLLFGGSLSSTSASGGVLTDNGYLSPSTGSGAVLTVSSGSASTITLSGATTFGTGTLVVSAGTLNTGTLTLTGAWPVLPTSTGFFPLSTTVITLSSASAALNGAVAPNLYVKSASFSMIDPPAVPEPSAIAMALVAVAGFLVLRRRAQLGR